MSFYLVVKSTVVVHYIGASAALFQNIKLTEVRVEISNSYYYCALQPMYLI